MKLKLAMQFWTNVQKGSVKCAKKQSITTWPSTHLGSRITVHARNLYFEYLKKTRALWNIFRMYDYSGLHDYWWVKSSDRLVKCCCSKLGHITALVLKEMQSKHGRRCIFLWKSRFFWVQMMVGGGSVEQSHSGGAQAPRVSSHFLGRVIRRDPF